MPGPQRHLLPSHERPFAEQIQRRRGLDAAEDDRLDVVRRAHAHLLGGDELFHAHFRFLSAAAQRHRKDRHAEGAGDQNRLGRRGDVLVAVAQQHQPLGAWFKACWPEAGGADLQRAGDVGGAAIHLGGDVGQAEAPGNAVFEKGVGAEYNQPGAVLRPFGAADGADELKRLAAHSGADAVRQVERENDVDLLVGLRQGETHQPADQQQQRQQPQGR